MMKTIHNTEFLQDIYQELLPHRQRNPKPNAKEKVLIESLIGDGTEENTAQHYTKDNGFGLYDPALEVNLPEITPGQRIQREKSIRIHLLRKGKARI